MSTFLIRSLTAATLACTAPGAALAICHHCPPEPTIGGVPQPTDDVLMQNGVNWAEASAGNMKTIMEYDGWDPAQRFRQFIIWFAGVAGPNIPTEADLRQQASTEGDSAPAELVLGQGKDALLGRHRIVVPVTRKGFIENGQLAWVETEKARYPLQVITAAAETKGYGGYLMLAGYGPDGKRLVFGIPSGESDLEWVYPLVRLDGLKGDATRATLYSDQGRGTRKR